MDGPLLIVLNGGSKPCFRGFLSVLDNLELENPDEFFFLHYGEKYRGQKSFLKEIAEETQRFQHVEKEPKFYLKYKDSKKKKNVFMRTSSTYSLLLIESMHRQAKSIPKK
ncbi:hypothetical protein QUB72_02825 [Enterococcus faecium]|nr:hypothetical protein [Enterococcus faecium]